MATSSKYALSRLLDSFDKTLAESGRLPLQSLAELAARKRRTEVDEQLSIALSERDKALSQVSMLSLELHAFMKRASQLEDKLAKKEEEHNTLRVQWKSNFERANRRFDSLRAAVESFPNGNKILEIFRRTPEQVKTDNCRTIRSTLQITMFPSPRFYLAFFII